MNEKKYAEGVRFFERKENQPDFVLGALIVTPEQLLVWAKSNPDLTSDYKGQQQVKFQVKRSKDGKVYIDLDTYKQGVKDEGDNLPF